MRACVHIYCVKELYEEAMDLALKVGHGRGVLVEECAYVCVPVDVCVCVCVCVYACICVTSQLSTGHIANLILIHTIHCLQNAHTFSCQFCTS